jgi:Family of unknown function (DUF5990)
MERLHDHHCHRGRTTIRITQPGTRHAVSWTAGVHTGGPAAAVRVRMGRDPNRHRGPRSTGRPVRLGGVPLHNVHVAVQIGKRPADLVRGDADSARWEIDVPTVIADGEVDLRGPAVHGKKGERFLYQTWGRTRSTERSQRDERVRYPRPVIRATASWTADIRSWWEPSPLRCVLHCRWRTVSRTAGRPGPSRTGVVLAVRTEVVRCGGTVAVVGRGDRKPVRWHNDRVRCAKQRSRRRARRDKGGSASPAPVRPESAERPSS